MMMASSHQSTAISGIVVGGGVGDGFDLREGLEVNQNGAFLCAIDVVYTANHPGAILLQHAEGTFVEHCQWRPEFPLEVVREVVPSADDFSWIGQDIVHAMGTDELPYLGFVHVFDGCKDVVDAVSYLGVGTVMKLT